MSASAAATIRDRVQQIETMPAIPAVFLPLMKLLSSSGEDVKLDEVVRLVSYDSNIAGQCLRVAASPLFGLAQTARIHQGSSAHLGITPGRDHAAYLLPGTGFPGGKMGAGSSCILAAFAGMRHGVPEIQREAGHGGCGKSLHGRAAP